MKKISKLITAFILVALVAVSAVGCTFKKSTENTGGGSQGGTVELQKVVFNTGTKETERKELSLIEAYNKVSRTSVAIEMITSAGTSAGSGVIIDMAYEQNADPNSVYIITCHHVVEDGGDIVVRLPDENCNYDNRDYIFEGVIGGGKASDDENAVSLIGGDKNTDIAVLKLDLEQRSVSDGKLTSDDIVKAQIPAEDYEISVAEEIFVVGNPGGTHPGWFGAGYIADVDVTASVEDIGAMALIGLDAHTNHGNSGGGLYNMYGELIGITNAGSDELKGINFAIPFETPYEETDTGFVNIASQLLGSYTGDNYGFIQGHKEKFGFTAAQGETSTGEQCVYVAAVTSGSQADNAGLKAEDIITVMSVNGVSTPISTVSQVTEIMQSLAIGDKVSITGTRMVNVGSPLRPIYRQENFSAELSARQFLFCDTGIYPS